MADDKELKSEDVLGFIGITDVKDLDELKTKFNEKYLPTETHNKTLGELNGKFTHALKKSFKELDVDIASDELKDINTVDVPALYSAKVKARFDDYETNSKLTKEQMESKLNDDLGKYKQQVNDWETKFSTVKTEYDDFKAKTESDNKNREVNTRLNTAKSGLTFSEQKSDLEKKGFFVSVKEKYSFEVTDNKEAVRNDKGELIMSKSNAGEAASFSEVYQDEFKAADLGAKSNPKKVTTFTGNGGGSNPIPPVHKREVAKRH